MSAVGVVSIGVLMFGFAWIVAEGWRNFPGATDDSIALVIRPAWLCWLVVGALTGRDLFWHPALHKCRALGLSTRRSYLLGVPLGFLSPPLVAVAFVLVARAYANAPGSGGRLPSLALAFVLASQTAMLCISIARSLLLRNEALPIRLLVAGSAVVIGSVTGVVLPLFGSVASPFSAIDLLAATMSGRSWPVIPSVLIVVLLTLTDATIYSVNVHSGLRGDRAFPVAWAERLRSRRRFWTRGGEHALSSIAMLGWLRNRASMLLFVWGLGYGFGYVFVSKPESPVGALAFFWMLSMFHSYLRGNLFGVDRRAAWWYSVIPQGLRGGLAAKNRSLSLLQYVMFGGVLLACVARGRPVFRQVETWVTLVSCAVAMTTVAEMVGSVTSVRWPDPIERASQYSGGTALGAFLVPAAITIVVIPLAMLVTSTPARLPPSVTGLIALSSALGFKALQVLHRRTALAEVIATHGEGMRKQLAAFKT
jgi:hypothetical protein